MGQNYIAGSCLIINCPDLTGEAGVAKGVEGGHFLGGVGQNLQSILSVENDLVQSGGAGVAEGIVERLRFLGRELLKKEKSGKYYFQPIGAS